MKLTAKQEKFAQFIADGMTQSDAYRAAYDAGAMKPETVQKRASELMRNGGRNGGVTGRVAAMHEQLQEKALWTREKSVLALSGIADDRESKSGEIVAAVKELNSMHGFNAPTKVDVAVTFPRVINVIAGRA